MNQIKTPKLLSTAISHQGMQRKNNEDRYGVTAFNLNQTPSLLAVVCDGIGGHQAGEVAAEVAVNTLTEVVTNSGGANPLETLEKAVQTANENVRAAAADQPGRRGMGATCVIAWMIGAHLYTTSVGDSPLFLIRDGAIRRLTTPHTWVQEAIEMGVLTEESARSHPNAHVIRRYLGMAEPLSMDFRLRLQKTETNEQAVANQGTLMQVGDILLMCSDGLTDMVETEQILSVILEKGRVEGVPALLDLANANGGMDNITIVAVEIGPEEAPVELDAKTVQIRHAPAQQTGKPSILRSKTTWIGCGLLALLATLAISTVLIIGLINLRRNVDPTPSPSLSAVPALQLTMQAAPDPQKIQPAQADPAVTAATP